MPLLIVDANARRRLTHEELLTQHGMRPATAGDEATAVDKIHRASKVGNPFRLVILDAGAPGPEDWPLFDRVHEAASRDQCALIVLVTASEAKLPAQYRELPKTQFLTKPAKYSEFLNAVEQALRDKPEETTVGGALDAKDRPLKILLAEDGLVNQEVAVGLLEMRGHHIEVANNGLEAIAALERQRFDLVLMDLEMPEMDGLEAAAAIRVMEQTSGGHTPIIAMTAHAVKGFRERCIHAGMDDYITKPIKPDELFKVVAAAAGASVT